MKNKKKSIVAIVLSLIFVLLFLGTSCSSCERFGKSCTSNVSGGLYRTVRVFDYEGDLIAQYEGKLDVQENDHKVLFDLDGKRYIYYNCLVEVVEK